jgi:predicted MFS family arabinose efflux permease
MAQGVGALIAAGFISAFSTLRRKGLLMTIGQFVFAVGLVLLAFAHNLPAAIVLIAVNGWATVAQLMMMNTLIQIDVPDMLRGRVFSVYLWAQQGVAPFGSLFIGWLAQAAGVPRAALVGGVVCLLVVVLAHAKWPVLRQKMA